MMILARKHIPGLLLLFLFLPINGLANTTTGWEVTQAAGTPEEIATWKKPVPHQSLDAFKGQLTVNHSLLTVLAVLSDIPNFPQWVFHCDSARMLPALGPNIAYIYIDGIWPVSDRDAVLRSTIKQNPADLTITIHSVATPKLLPAKKGVVRMPALDNTFILTPLSPTKTRITFITFADPGGLIPAWLANFVAKSAPYDTLRDMRKRMQLPQYQITQVDQLPVLLSGAKELVMPSWKTSGK